MAKGFGVSPITNIIYYGTQNPEKQVWTGKKEDVTNEVIAAVFEWFIGNMDGKGMIKFRCEKLDNDDSCSYDKYKTT